MSFLLYRQQIDRLLNEYNSRVIKGYEKISDKYRGYEWQDVTVPEHLRLGAKFGDVMYFGEETRHDEHKRQVGILVDKVILGSLKHYRRTLNRGTPSTMELLKNRLASQRAIKRSAMEQIHAPSAGSLRRLEKLADIVSRYETSLTSSLVHFNISKSPHASGEQIVLDTMPLEVEYVLDVTEMGFSGKATPDFVFHNPLSIGELKTGARSQKHKISIAGYALAYEKQRKEDVNVGFVLYFDTNSRLNTPVFRVDAFVITDVFRSLFVEKMYALLNTLYRQNQNR